MADKMLRIAGRGNDETAKAISTDNDGKPQIKLFARDADDNAVGVNAVQDPQTGLWYLGIADVAPRAYDEGGDTLKVSEPRIRDIITLWDGREIRDNLNHNTSNLAPYFQQYRKVDFYVQTDLKASGAPVLQRIAVRDTAKNIQANDANASIIGYSTLTASICHRITEGEQLLSHIIPKDNSTPPKVFHKADVWNDYLWLDPIYFWVRCNSTPDSGSITVKLIGYK